MRGVVSARCPHKKDDPCAPHAKALKPRFAVVLAVILHRDHGRVEDRFKVCEIDSVLAEVFTAFRLVPGDYEQTVYAGYASVKKIVDADERKSKGPGSITLQVRYPAPGEVRLAASLHVLSRSSSRSCRASERFPMVDFDATPARCHRPPRDQAASAIAFGRRPAGPCRFGPKTDIAGAV